MNSESEEILSYLDYIRSQNRLVSVVSSFKGVSFTLAVNIISVIPKENAITVSTQGRQNMSLLPNTQIDIHSDLFPHTVMGMVSTVDTPRKSAVLANFSYQRRMDENRTHVRYQTREDIPVTISLENTQYTAHIHDISIEGISVMFDRTTRELGGDFLAGKSSRLKFSLRLADDAAAYTLNIPAKIAYAFPTDDEKYRVGMQTFPTASDQSILRRYIFDKQTEMFRGKSNPEILT